MQSHGNFGLKFLLKFGLFRMSQQNKLENFAKDFAPNCPPPRRKLRPKLRSAESLCKKKRQTNAITTAPFSCFVQLCVNWTICEARIRQMATGPFCSNRLPNGPIDRRNPTPTPLNREGNSQSKKTYCMRTKYCSTNSPNGHSCDFIVRFCAH